MDVLQKTEKEIINDYDEDVEAYLCDHEQELGIRMKDCSYMVVDGNDMEHTYILI